MNREIKFRAWNQVENTMHHNCGINPNGDGYRIFDKDGAVLDWYGSQPLLMQYTGLKDKNGKEIYEGDIMTADYMSADNSMGLLPNGWTFDADEDRFVVIWDNELSGWTFDIDSTPSEDVKKEFGKYSESYMMKYQSHARHILISGDEGIGEVIGNIHQNPELL